MNQGPAVFGWIAKPTCTGAVGPILIRRDNAHAVGELLIMGTLLSLITDTVIGKTQLVGKQDFFADTTVVESFLLPGGVVATPTGTISVAIHPSFSDHDISPNDRIATHWNDPITGEHLCHRGRLVASSDPTSVVFFAIPAGSGDPIDVSQPVVISREVVRVVDVNPSTLVVAAAGLTRSGVVAFRDVLGLGGAQGGELVVAKLNKVTKNAWVFIEGWGWGSNPLLGGANIQEVVFSNSTTRASGRGPGQGYVILHHD